MAKRNEFSLFSIAGAASWSLSDAGEGTPAMDLSVMGQENAGAEVQFSTYDAFNRLVGQRQGGMEASYTYGVDGLRLSKTVNGATTAHIWDGSQMVGERNSSGALAGTYIRGNGLIAAGNNSGAPSSYYLYNGHGDVVQLTDSKGAVTRNYTYDAFGNEGDMDDSDINPFRYAGEYFDQETGDIYLRARYYSPGTGRFGSEDPIRDGLNWYVYCENNPIMFIDPSGLDSYILHDQYEKNDNSFFTYKKLSLMQKELKKLYGTKVHLIPVSSGSDIVDNWNDKVGFDAKGNAVDIDAVVIYAHASGTGYNFTKKDGSAFNDKRFLASNISSLNAKDMKVFISLGCNTGNSTMKSNIATLLIESQPGIKKVLAADGSVNIGTTGSLAWKKVTIKTTQGARTGTLDGYKVYTRDDKGNIVITPFGGFGHQFKGIKDLIESAK